MKKSYIVLFLSFVFACLNFSNLKAQDNAAMTLVKDGNPIVLNAIGDSCAGTGQEKHDDGSFENGIGWNASVTNGGFALKFRPSLYPWKYNKFCIALTRQATGSDSLKFDVVIYDSTGPGGTPGNLLGTLSNQVARPILIFPAFSWFSYDISSVLGNTVTSGAVYIGVRYDGSPANQTFKFAMFDQTATTPLWPGYAQNAAAPWQRIDSIAPPTFALYRSFAMRTVGASPSGGTCNYSYAAQTSGTTNQLLTVSTVSATVGWAAGVGSTVVRTTNGTTWSSATGTGITGDVYNIWGIDANTALCTTTPAATFIYKTTNGGTTWTQVFTQAAPGFIDAIQMISPTEGYALGDPVTAKWTVLKTTDGGNTWARMATEPTQVGAEAGWNNSLHIVGTHIWFGTNATRVYHSPDLGLTWSSGATTGTANTYAVHFNTVTNGLAGGTAMVRTVNGGANYTLVTSPGTAGNINGISGAGTDWWAIRSGAVIYRSIDAGATWTSPYTQTGAVFQDLDLKVIANCPQGWAVGNAGAIAKMTAIVGISNYNSEVPTSYSLNQNYPNPFNPSTNINFSIPKSGLVTLKIYDMVGREVSSLVNEFKSAGNYVVGFNASALSSGTYFYRIEANDFIATKKMVLVK